MYAAWKKYFQHEDDVEVSLGDIFGPGDHLSADAIISPANSFGFMDGGIDYIYSLELGWGMSDDLRRVIHKVAGGELLVGQSAVIPIRRTNPDAKIPYLISAPTMRVPMSVAGTVNAYLAFRSALKSAEDHEEINSILCPGLGTAVGEMPHVICAIQMYEAYRQRKEPEVFDVLGTAHMHHHFMLSPEAYDPIFQVEHPEPQDRE
jgi:O-acetyl-ADP-ribose deacetylase (regulator of RNase III)